jgi:hypothetical protein
MKDESFYYCLSVYDRICYDLLIDSVTITKNELV